MFNKLPPLSGPVDASGEPSVACPVCGIVVQQVASASLSLALWQHWNWVCDRRSVTPPRLADLQRICNLNVAQAMAVQQYIERLPAAAVPSPPVECANPDFSGGRCRNCGLGNDAHVPSPPAQGTCDPAPVEIVTAFNAAGQSVKAYAVPADNNADELARQRRDGVGVFNPKFMAEDARDVLEKAPVADSPTKAKWIELIICARCGQEIKDGGLCGWQCELDGDLRDARQPADVISERYILASSRKWSALSASAGGDQEKP